MGEDELVMHGENQNLRAPEVPSFPKLSKRNLWTFGVWQRSWTFSDKNKNLKAPEFEL